MIRDILFIAYKDLVWIYNTILAAICRISGTTIFHVGTQTIFASTRSYSKNASPKNIQLRIFGKWSNAGTISNIQKGANCKKRWSRPNDLALQESIVTIWSRGTAGMVTHNLICNWPSIFGSSSSKLHAPYSIDVAANIATMATKITTEKPPSTWADFKRINLFILNNY